MSDSNQIKLSSERALNMQTGIMQICIGDTMNLVLHFLGCQSLSGQRARKLPDLLSDEAYSLQRDRRDLVLQFIGCRPLPGQRAQKLPDVAPDEACSLQRVRQVTLLLHLATTCKAMRVMVFGNDASPPRMISLQPMPGCDSEEGIMGKDSYSSHICKLVQHDMINFGMAGFKGQKTIQKVRFVMVIYDVVFSLHAVASRDLDEFDALMKHVRERLDCLREQIDYLPVYADIFNSFLQWVHKYLDRVRCVGSLTGREVDLEREVSRLVFANRPAARASDYDLVHENQGSAFNFWKESVPVFIRNSHHCSFDWKSFVRCALVRTVACQIKLVAEFEHDPFAGTAVMLAAL